MAKDSLAQLDRIGMSSIGFFLLVAATLCAVAMLLVGLACLATSSAMPRLAWTMIALGACATGLVAYVKRRSGRFSRVLRARAGDIAIVRFGRTIPIQFRGVVSTGYVELYDHDNQVIAELTCDVGDLAQMRQLVVAWVPGARVIEESRWF